MKFKALIAMASLFLPLLSYASDVNDSGYEEDPMFWMEISSIANGATFTPKIYDFGGNEILHERMGGMALLSPDWEVSCSTENEYVAFIQSSALGKYKIIPSLENNYATPFVKIKCIGKNTVLDYSVTAEKHSTGE